MCFWALCEFLRDFSTSIASTSKGLQGQQARTRQLIYAAMLTRTLLRGPVYVHAACTP